MAKIVNFREILRNALYQEIAGTPSGVLAEIPDYRDQTKFLPVYLRYPYPSLETLEFPLIFVALGDENYAQGYETTRPHGRRTFDMRIAYYSSERPIEELQTTMLDIEETSLAIEKAVLQSSWENNLPGQLMEFTPNSITYDFQEQNQVPYGSATHSYTITYMVDYSPV